MPSARSPNANSSEDGTTWRSRPTFSSTRATFRPFAWALAMRTTESAIASSCIARASADPRQRVADELVHHPPSAERGLHEHHPGRLRADLADLGGLLAAGQGAHRLERSVGVVGGDERDQLALVGDVHRIDAQQLGGEEFLTPFRQAARDELDAPFVLVIEGSIPNENINGEGYWTSFGNDEATGEPLTLNWWLDQLAPKAWGVVAVGTCATYGGIHAMAGNPTGCMGLADYLGWDFRSAGGLPIVNIPGCPVQPENFMETLTWVLYHAAGAAPPPPLDELLRPQWLFGKTVHEGCDRAGYYEQADFAHDYNSPKCLVKVGCWGPVVNCNVTKRGWMDGIGGCPNVGGICIACTMPGFPDKFMPFMDEPPGARMSTSAVLMYGRAVRALRNFTKLSLDKEPERSQS
ncbi:MAG TPA: hypothetical protein VE269_01800, partial [Gaiellaceae bacterium]|nr:hypothetical protein [Gaiellaceae bacterium]